MPTLALLLALPLTLPTQAPAAGEAPPKPEVALFARAFVVGSDLTEGYGLDAELGVPGSLADVVSATLRFEHPPIQKRTFPTASVASQQVRGAVDANATIVIALDYLLPFVYAETGGEEGRRASLDLALRSLEQVQVPLVLGDVPDLHAALTAEKPILFAKQMPSPEGLKAVNERVVAWAHAHKNVTLAPMAAMFAHIANNEPFGVRRSSWPQAWLPDLLMKDRMHTRLHGTIAAWLLGLDAVCSAHLELDAGSFDWSPLSVYRSVYAAKDAERMVANERLVALRRLPPNRPPPPVIPPEVQRQTAIEEVRAKERSARGERELPPGDEKERKGRSAKEQADKDGG